MWDAKRKRSVYDPNTQTTVEIEEEDREMQKYTMDRRLSLGGYSNGTLPENRTENAPVTQIVFNTLNVNQVQEEK